MRTTRAQLETWAGFQALQQMLMVTDAEILQKILMAVETVETILVTTLAITLEMIQTEMESLIHSMTVQTEIQIGIRPQTPTMMVTDAEMPRKTLMTIMMDYQMEMTGVRLEV